MDAKSDPHILKIIGHGTTGIDGIEPGNHLRWAFNHKLGFPECARLFRRRSYLQNHFTLTFPEEDDNPGPLIFPSKSQLYTDIIGYSETIGVEFESSQKSAEYVFAAYGSRRRYVLNIKTNLTISLARPVSRIELGFVVTGNSNFQIFVDSEKHRYFPLRISGSDPGWKDVYFDVEEADRIRLIGKGISLFHLGIWLCRDIKDNPWQEIKLDCGCGLPLEEYSKLSVNTKKNKLPGIKEDIIDCRLNSNNLKPGNTELISRDSLTTVAKLLPGITHEGVQVPHGWTIFTDDTSVDTSEESLETTVSVYDYLLTQTLHVPVARIFDLYFVDHPPRNDNSEYYDYKIEASWPHWNMRKLDQQISFDHLEIGQHFNTLYRLDDLLFYAVSDSRIVESPSDFARVRYGLELVADDNRIEFRFIKPVTEVQLWIDNRRSNSPVIVDAFRDYHVDFKDRQRIAVGSQQIVSLHADAIDLLRIELDSETILLRLHYDFEQPPYFTESAQVCGIKDSTNPYALEIPHGLESNFMLGGTVNQADVKHEEFPYLIGLRWEANEDANVKLLPLNGLLFDLERKLKFSKPGKEEKIPLLISPSLENHNAEVRAPESWPDERQYYLDYLRTIEDYKYRISARDIFGRLSQPCKFIRVDVELPPPPPPVQVTAHYLDYSAYDPETNKSTNQGLTQVDKNWLYNNRQSAIVVRWKWTSSLQGRAPDVDRFQIFLHRGWLNTYTGRITGEVVSDEITNTNLDLSANEQSEFALLTTSADITVWQFTVEFDDNVSLATDALRLCWMRQGNISYLVLNNSSGNSIQISALRQSSNSNAMPLTGQKTSFTVSAEKQGFVNYSLAENWQAGDPLDFTTGKNSAINYTVYLPMPPFPAGQLDANNTVLYAQIGVCAIAAEQRGSVSGPATIMSVYQHPPAAPGLPSYTTGSILTATAANVHGKSTFHLRWHKSNDEVEYFIYRAMDTSLITLDNQRRENGDSADYGQTVLSQFDPSDVLLISQISYIANAEDRLSIYKSLTPTQWMVLANLQENEEAYTKLHGQSLVKDDPRYQDSDTDIPRPGQNSSYGPDPGLMLYADDTLDGRSPNRYFYKIEAVGQNALPSQLSLSTPPVECPLVMPPAQPVITKIVGGENQIIVCWAKNPQADITGYLVYRTNDQKKSNDWRRMQLIKNDPDDLYSITVSSPLPSKEFEFVDVSVEARKQYYYSIIAVNVLASGKKLKSKHCKAMTAQAYKLSPPIPPVISSIEWIRIDSDGNLFDIDDPQAFDFGRKPAVLLNWEITDSQLKYLVQYSTDYFNGYKNASDWLVPGESNFVHLNSYLNFKHSYRIQVVDQYGNISVDMPDIILPARGD